MASCCTREESQNCAQDNHKSTIFVVKTFAWSVSWKRAVVGQRACAGMLGSCIQQGRWRITGSASVGRPGILRRILDRLASAASTLVPTVPERSRGLSKAQLSFCGPFIMDWQGLVCLVLEADIKPESTQASANVGNRS